ncbi:MAG: SH3 domain-containing protein [Thainema sp.]
MKCICQWSVLSAIATVPLGAALPAWATPGHMANSHPHADANVREHSTTQPDSSAQPDLSFAEQALTAQDAVLRIAPDPRATATGQIAAGTPVRVTHQSDRYFYIEVSDPDENQATEPIRGWVLACQLYSECE